MPNRECRIVLRACSGDRISEHLGDGGAKPTSRLAIPFARRLAKPNEDFQSINFDDRSIAEMPARRSRQPPLLDDRRIRLAFSSRVGKKLIGNGIERAGARNLLLHLLRLDLSRRIDTV